MIKKLNAIIADLHVHNCFDCPYLDVKYVARYMDNKYKCKALKYKTIDCFDVQTEQASFCPYKKTRATTESDN